MSDLNCVFEGLDGKGAIYISTIHAAKNLITLKSTFLAHSEHNIKAILTIARGGQVFHSKEDVPHYLYLAADDH